MENGKKSAATILRTVKFCYDLNDLVFLGCPIYSNIRPFHDLVKKTALHLVPVLDITHKCLL